MPNLAKIIYEIFVRTAYKLGLYHTRTDRYIKHFENHITKGSTILDLGCGSGIFSQKLSYEIIISVDINPSILKTHPPNLSIYKICADAQHIPVRRNSMDIVLAISLLEHISNTPLVIDEVNRILKPNGLLIIQLPNPQWYIEPHTKFPLLFTLPKCIKNAVRKQLKYDYVNFELTLKALEKLTRNHFTVTKRISLYHGLKTPPWPPAWLMILRKIPSPTMSKPN